MSVSKDSEKINIAMWSGPRNLSTAMMYSFAERSDTFVVDEPFYAAYLKDTGIQHALYQEIIQAGETKADRVADFCTAEIPENKTVFYQKQMTKHMLPAYNRDWINTLTNVFLIRDPARVIASYHAKEEDPGFSDIGIKEQTEIFEMVADKQGQAPVVIDSADILNNPQGMLTKLCEAIGLSFDPSMLRWAAGPRSFDGIWAPHWYQSVWKSTGFASPEKPAQAVAEHLKPLLDKALPYYEKLSAYKLKN